MDLIFSGQTYQFVSWFIVLLSCITGLYCLVINFGGKLNRLVFFFAFVAAIRHIFVALMLNQSSTTWIDGLKLLDLSLIGILRAVQLLITLHLLRPLWWKEPLRWVTRGVIGLSLLFPLIILADIFFETRLYYAGLKPHYPGGYVSSRHIIPGDYFAIIDFLGIVPSGAWALGITIYALFFDKPGSRLLRQMAVAILMSHSVLLLLWFVPNHAKYAIIESLMIVSIGSCGYLAAIFLKIFSEPPFHRGSLQNRLVNVSLATTVPILVAVGLLAQQSVWAAWSAIMFGTSMSVVLTWLTVRYSIQPIQLLTDTATAITAGDLQRKAPVVSQDEVGKLALAFNSMTFQLRASIDNLEARVLDRTRELERRTNYLETSSRVGQHVTSILDQNELLAQVVDLIQAGFGYYFVSIWLLNSNKKQLQLQAGSGRMGKMDSGNIPPIAMNQSALIVSVCKTGVYRVVNDVTEAAEYLLLELLPDTRAELVLPLRINDQTIGVLDIQSDEKGSFHYDDTIVFQTLANEIAIAIRNAQLYEGEQRRRLLAEALQRTGRELSGSLDLSEIPGLILEQLYDVVPYSRGGVLLEEANSLHIVAQRGFPDDNRVSELEVPIRRGDVYQQLVGTSQPIIVDNVAESPHWYQVDWLPLDLSWMGVPLVSKDRVIGMISLTRGEAGTFNQEDANLVSAFASHAAIALENAQLYDQITSLNEKLEHKVESRTAELNKAYQHLSRLDQTKSDFIQVVAHELRTPLTVIKGYAQILDNGTEPSQNGEADPLINGIISGVERMQEIVNSMLDLTKLESETQTVDCEKNIISHIINQVEQHFKTVLTERHVSLTLQALDTLPQVPGDADLLYKLFYHLTINAIKYVPDGGSILIRGETINDTEQGPAVKIIVSDTGIGIDPSHHDLIFEKFYQTGKLEIHSSGKTSFKGGGPGLGLAIAQAIVVAHNGRIWVESPGHNERTLPGSHFHVLLPLNGKQP